MPGAVWDISKTRALGISMDTMLSSMIRAIMPSMSSVIQTSSSSMASSSIMYWEYS
jgi:hypothetical protein